jgi:hypothetical protein
MAEDKKPKKNEDDVKTLREKLDAIAFNDKQANKRLKASLARNRQRRVASAGRVSGLGKLQGLATFKTK